MAFLAHVCVYNLGIFVEYRSTGRTLVDRRVFYGSLVAVYDSSRGVGGIDNLGWFMHTW